MKGFSVVGYSFELAEPVNKCIYEDLQDYDAAVYVTQVSGTDAFSIRTKDCLF